MNVLRDVGRDVTNKQPDPTIPQQQVTVTDFIAIQRSALDMLEASLVTFGVTGRTQSESHQGT